MTGRTHDMIAVTGGSAAAVAFGLPFGAAVTLTIGSFLTSRLPDQAEGEWAEHRGPTHRVYAPLVMGAIVFVISTWLLHQLRNRFALETDRLDAARINHGASIAAHYLRTFAIGVVLGSALHLFADSLTITGVPWRKTRLHLLPRRFRFRTGGPAERILQTAIMLGILWLAYGEVHHVFNTTSHR